MDRRNKQSGQRNLFLLINVKREIVSASVAIVLAYYYTWSFKSYKFWDAYFLFMVFLEHVIFQQIYHIIFNRNPYRYKISISKRLVFIVIATVFMYFRFSVEWYPPESDVFGRFVPIDKRVKWYRWILYCGFYLASYMAMISISFVRQRDKQ